MKQKQYEKICDMRYFSERYFYKQCMEIRIDLVEGNMTILQFENPSSIHQFPCIERCNQLIIKIRVP